MMTAQEAARCTPRDWQLSEQRKALELMGTGEEAPHLMAAKRLGMCADVIEWQAAVLEQQRQDLLQVRAMLHATESARTSTTALEALPAQPVAWGLFAMVCGEWVLQHPVRHSEEEAAYDRRHYKAGTELMVAPLVIGAQLPVLAAPQPDHCEQARGMVQALDLAAAAFGNGFLIPKDREGWAFACHECRRADGSGHADDCRVGKAVAAIDAAQEAGAQ